MGADRQELSDSPRGTGTNSRALPQPGQRGSAEGESDQLRAALERALDADRQAERIRCARAVFYNGRHRSP
ncbi:hypothetical protein [Streptomyces sp. NPDC059349]|uniref:hypothetical protein n=1 Tax=Streptomyces sp. NPDC059349 TaxID=3346808 RepID=UPI0036B56B4A